MYETLDHARAALSAHFEPEHVETLLPTLQPAIGFRQLEAGKEAAPGGARLGGTPDLSPLTLWPMRQIPADPDEIAERGGSAHRKTLREALSRPAPYAFIAQINLSEAASLGGVASCLPSDGRLLFFYDLETGPWNNGRETCCVLWDRSPPETLMRQPDKPELQDYSSGPAQPLRLVSELRPTAPASLEAQNGTALAGALEDEDFAETYEEMLSGLSDGDGLTRSFLLGSPLPEQGDPRYDAVVADMFGKPDLSRTEWKTAFPAVSKAAASWLLLLQVDIAAWLRQPYSEGTIYFVISRENLAARAFDQVFAIYQQT